MCIRSHESTPLLFSSSSDSKLNDHHRNDSPFRNIFGTQTMPYCIMTFSAIFNALLTFLSHTSESKFNFPANSAFAVCAIVTVALAVVVISVRNLFHLFVLSPTQWFLLFLRGLFGSLGALLMYLSFTHISAGTAITLFYTTPAFTSLLSSLVLGEKFTKNLFFVLILNIAGVSLVSRPVLANTMDAAMGIAEALLAALVCSAGYIVVKVLGSQVHFAQNVLSYGLACAVLALLTTSTEEWTQLSTNVAGMGFALAGAIAGFVSKSTLNYALPLCPGGSGIVVRSLSVPLTFLLGMIHSGDTLTLSGLLGVIFVLLSVAITAAKT